MQRDLLMHVKRLTNLAMKGDLLTRSTVQEQASDCTLFLGSDCSLGDLLTRSISLGDVAAN
jgi:hypothetical protein